MLMVMSSRRTISEQSPLPNQHTHNLQLLALHTLYPSAPGAQFLHPEWRVVASPLMVCYVHVDVAWTWSHCIWCQLLIMPSIKNDLPLIFVLAGLPATHMQLLCGGSSINNDLLW